MLRDRDAAVAHDLLEQVLVHAERRGCHPCTDVRDVRELEQSLHRAVLAEGAVQDRQHDVDVGSVPGTLSGRDRQCLCGPCLGDCPLGHGWSGRASSQRPSRPIAQSPRRSARDQRSEHERAEASEMSCSLDLPPARIATRRRRLTGRGRWWSSRSSCRRAAAREAARRSSPSSSVSPASPAGPAGARSRPAPRLPCPRARPSP